MEKSARKIPQFEFAPMEVERKGIDWGGNFNCKSATVVGSRVYLLGGSKPLHPPYEEIVKVVEYLDLQRGSFVNIETVTPIIDEFYPFLINDNLFMIGVELDSDEVVLWSFDLILAVWARLETKSVPPCKLVYITCEFVEQLDEIVFYGGGSEATLFALNVDSLKWKTLKSTGTSPGDLKGSTSCSLSSPRGTTMFIFGGRRYGCYSSNLYGLHCEYNGYRWSQARMGNSFTQVCNGSATCWSGMVFIYGGNDHHMQEVKQLIQYNPLEDTAMDLSNNVKDLLPRSFAQIVGLNDSILIFGGFGREFSDIVVLKPVES